MSLNQTCKTEGCWAKPLVGSPYCWHHDVHNAIENKPKVKRPTLGIALKQNEDYCGACLEVYSSNFNHVCKPLTVCDKANDSFFVEDNKSIKQKLKACILSQIESMTGQVGKLDLEIGVYKKVLNQLELL